MSVVESASSDRTQSTLTEYQYGRNAHRNEGVLRELYHGRGLTTREIANRLGCTNGTVSRWLNRHGIETRENWKAGVEAAREVTREERVTVRTLPSGYDADAFAGGDL